MTNEKKSKKKRRSFTPEFKAEAVSLVLEQGLSRGEVARDLDVAASVIGRWVSAAEAAKEPGAPCRVPSERSRSASDGRTGWDLQTHMQTALCLGALDQAVALRRPGRGLLHHTDRGSQYTSDAYQQALRRVGATPSMSRKGNCWDNAVSESFFGTLEQELVRQLDEPWHDEHDARSAVGEYIQRFYNHQRRHSSIGNVSPVEFEAAARAGALEAA